MRNQLGFQSRTVCARRVNVKARASGCTVMRPSVLRVADDTLVYTLSQLTQKEGEHQQDRFRVGWAGCRVSVLHGGRMLTWNRKTRTCAYACLCVCACVRVYVCVCVCARACAGSIPLPLSACEFVPGDLAQREAAKLQPGCSKTVEAGLQFLATT